MNIIAYQTKSEEDYLYFYSELQKNGYTPFLTFGYKEGTYLASEIGSKTFTDGILLTREGTTYVNSIDEYLSNDKI